jgi:hypothetical protein
MQETPNQDNGNYCDIFFLAVLDYIGRSKDEL